VIGLSDFDVVAVQNARAAIRYLEQAEELGHEGAAEELLRAYRRLVKHYTPGLVKRH
jgi:TPR repeat protein